MGFKGSQVRIPPTDKIKSGTYDNLRIGILLSGARSRKSAQQSAQQIQSMELGFNFISVSANNYLPTPQPHQFLQYHVIEFFHSNFACV